MSLERGQGCSARQDDVACSARPSAVRDQHALVSRPTLASDVVDAARGLFDALPHPKLLPSPPSSLSTRNSNEEVMREHCSWHACVSLAPATLPVQEMQCKTSVSYCLASQRVRPPGDKCSASFHVICCKQRALISAHQHHIPRCYLIT